ncbi:MAG: hypothetical protein AAGE99_02215 [Chlamydiota bacterium]
MLNLFFKKFSIVFGAVCPFLSFSCFCDSNIQDNPFPHRNHIRFGPDFIVYSQDKNIKNITSKGTRFFRGLRFVYEHLYPNSFYAGLDLASAGSDVDFKAYRNGNRLSFDQANREFGNFDLRLGYTLSNQNGSYMISPFLGLGIYDISPEDRHNHEGLKEDRFPYFSGGAKFKYEIGSFFDFGCNIKVLYVFREKVRFKIPDERVCQINRLWGGEIGIPFTWHFSKTKRWNIELEPYFLTLGFSKEQMAFGTKLLFGFNF